VHRLGVLEAPERDDALEGRFGAGTDGDDERVVRQVRAGGRRDALLIGVHRGEPLLDELGGVVGGDPLEGIPARARPRERVLDAERADEKLGGGGQKRGGDAVAGQAVKGDERLEAGDAAAGDDDPVGGGRLLFGHSGTVGDVDAGVHPPRPKSHCGISAAGRSLLPVSSGPWPARNPTATA
jgi:hypothetical protein